MNIEINEKYRLTSDSMNFILQEKCKEKKDGSEYNNIAYCSALSGAITSISRRLLLTSTAKTADALVRDLKDVQAIVDTLTKKMAQIEPQGAK